MTGRGGVVRIALALVVGGGWAVGCVTPGQSFFTVECPSVRDGVCDEPVGCLAPDDAFDCGYCPWVEDDACDEPGRGSGECPTGTDLVDCGYCPTANDGICDEDGGACPEGTDPVDCCATAEDGVCEEISRGGECMDGSDFYDCGYCPQAWVGDGSCDGDCPEGTDADDCFSACFETWLGYYGPCFVESSFCGPVYDDEVTYYCFYDPAISSERGVCAQECNYDSDCFTCDDDWLTQPTCYFNTLNGEGVCVTPCSSDQECRIGQVCSPTGGYCTWPGW